MATELIIFRSTKFYYLNFTKKFLSIHPSAEAAHLNLRHQRLTLLRKIILELLEETGRACVKREKGVGNVPHPFFTGNRSLDPGDQGTLKRREKGFIARKRGKSEPGRKRHHQYFTAVY